MKKSTKITLVSVSGVSALLLAAGIASASSGSASHPVAQPKPSASAPAYHDPAAVPTTTAPLTPTGTTSQQQALAAAESYLTLNTGFSRQGLIDQLTSPSGDHFSVADATWAVDQTGANWNAQALMSANGYLGLNTGFSYNGLIQQLTAPLAGEFTYSQAKYAADHCGADWNAQAVLSAKGYLALGTGFSRDSMIQQLTSSGDGFTYNQAAYAATQVGLTG
jgi:Host cell surface-exposed lipoprotein